MTYDNVEQRMVHTYLDTFPDFVPSEQGPSFTAQKQFYQFIETMYRRLAEEPELLVGQLHDDDAYVTRFNKTKDNKPKLQTHMRKATKQVDALLSLLFELGQAGQVVEGALVVGGPVRINKRQRLTLEKLGLQVSAESGQTTYRHDTYGAMFPAWKWMASRPGASLVAFSRCMFLEGYPYSSQIYARLSGSEASYRRLEEYLLGHGYARLENLEGQVTVDYVKPHDDSAITRSGFLFRLHHTGVAASCDLLVKEPQIFGLCIPRMKEVLAAFDTMPESVQAFVLSHTKKCDECRYCVQTDKTGTRPLAAVPIDYQGQTFRLCPYYPGFSYCWTRLDDTVVADMIGMLAFMDRLFDDD